MEIGVGSIVEGKVTGITKFGAFVSIPEGKSGLVHISEIANQYVSDVADHLSEGQAVKVKVISIDEQGRINLSIKKAEPPAPRPERTERFERSERPERPPFRPNGGGGFRPNGGGGGFRGAPRNAGFQGKPASKEPTDFEDRLKQFMSNSDNKLSEIRQQEKRSTRRKK